MNANESLGNEVLRHFKSLASTEGVFIPFYDVGD